MKARRGRVGEVDVLEDEQDDAAVRPAARAARARPRRPADPSWSGATRPVRSAVDVRAASRRAASPGTRMPRSCAAPPTTARSARREARRGRPRARRRRPGTACPPAARRPAHGTITTPGTRAMRAESSSRRRVQPMPAGPVSTTRPGRPSATLRTASASWASSRSRPTNAMRRRITAPGPICHILPPWPNRCPAAPGGASRQHAQRAGRRGVALLHEVAAGRPPIRPSWATRPRKAHGANKPPRLMARLIEFFSRGGELVLDPFAGVGGTLLGAAICRAPRRALGLRDRAALGGGLRGGRGRGARPSATASARCCATSGDSRPGRAARVRRRSGCRMVVGDAAHLAARRWRRHRRLRGHRPALQPPAAS